jgi:hypothetical protein
MWPETIALHRASSNGALDRRRALSQHSRKGLHSQQCAINHRKICFFAPNSSKALGGGPIFTLRLTGMSRPLLNLRTE